MNKKIIAALASAAILASGILAIFLAKENTENMTSKNIFFYENISYGKHERNVLDLALPENATGDIGLVLFIHGGAWIMGDKSEYNAFIRQYSEDLQIAAAAINYRYISEIVHIDSILNDIDAALLKIKETAAGQGLNINKVLLTGTSAGAHLSMLYAYKCKDSAPVKPAAVFSFCGPTDLYDDSFYISGTLGTTEEICRLLSKACGKSFTPDTKGEAKTALDAASPLTYVDADICPTAICHGEKDSVVPYSNAMSILDAFEKHGVVYDFISFPNSDHDLGSDPSCLEQALELLQDYAERYLK